MLRASGFFSRTSRMQINRKFNASELSQLVTPKPPKSLQSEFEAKLFVLRKIQVARKKRTEKIESLFQALLSLAFSGDLTAKWREAHMKELLVEMEEQARYLNSNVNDYQKAAELQGSLFESSSRA